MAESSKPRSRRKIKRTFRIPLVDGAERAFVVGEFNEWSTTANPMTRDEKGFVAEIPLEPGRAYRFRYLLDDDRWENDWNADAYVPNEYGGDDSVIDLTDAALEAAKPKKQTSKATKAAPPATDGDAAPAPRRRTKATEKS